MTLEHRIRLALSLVRYDSPIKKNRMFRDYQVEAAAHAIAEELAPLWLIALLALERESVLDAQGSHAFSNDEEELWQRALVRIREKFKIEPASGRKLGMDDVFALRDTMHAIEREAKYATASGTLERLLQSFDWIEARIRETRREIGR